MSSPPAHRDAGDPASEPIFTDEILGEIFLRLDSAADLARASAACTAFLRVVRFLRRNRSLYRQPVVGFLEIDGHVPRHPHCFYHAEPPHRSASAARALAEAADFNLSFLPNPGSWRVHDAAGGRLLLSSDSSDDLDDVELVVCDPLYRRYVRIPSIPDELTAAIDGCYHQIVFAPTVEEEGSSFRVILMAYEDWEMKVTAFVFSSATSQWRRLISNGWTRDDFGIVPTSCCYHPLRSLYRTCRMLAFNEVLMLDTRKMEFSVVRTPLDGDAIVEAGEGRLGLLTIRDGMLDLYCAAWQGNGVSVEEWQHEKTIPIPLPTPDSDRYYISFCGAGDGYLLLRATPPYSAEPDTPDSAEPDSSDSAELEQMPEIHYYFTLHVKTLLVERLCMLNKWINVALLYTNFPPPLSLPSV